MHEELGQSDLNCCFTNLWIGQCILLVQSTHIFNKGTMAPAAPSQCRAPCNGTKCENASPGIAVIPPATSVSQWQQDWRTTTFNRHNGARKNGCYFTPCPLFNVRRSSWHRRNNPVVCAAQGSSVRSKILKRLGANGELRESADFPLGAPELASNTRPKFWKGTGIRLDREARGRISSLK